MSVNIKRNGTLQKLADQTILFDANCAEVRTGSFSSGVVAGDSYATVSITFSTPMPDNDYIVIFRQDAPAAGEIGFRTCTTTGFNLFVLGGRYGTAAEAMTFTGTYYAFKLVELEGYTSIYNKILNSIDSSPTPNSTNLCESGGIYDAIKNASSVFIGTADEWDSEENKTDYQLAVITDSLNINTVNSTSGATTPVADYSGIWTGTQEDFEELTSAEKANIKIVNIVGDSGSEEGFQYSTSEQWTGKKWIDGKKIYQKVINIGALPDSSSKDVNHNINNLDKIINYYGSAQTSEGGCICLPYISTGGNSVQLWADSTIVRAITIEDRTAYSGYIILEYTKTTD